MLGNLPEPIETECDSRRLSFAFHLAENDPVFRGHFDGLPVLAGVVQVHWAMLLASRLGFSAEDFSSSPRIKFKQLVRPPIDLT